MAAHEWFRAQLCTYFPEKKFDAARITNNIKNGEMVFVAGTVQMTLDSFASFYRDGDVEMYYHRRITTCIDDVDTFLDAHIKNGDQVLCWIRKDWDVTNEPEQHIH